MNIPVCCPSYHRPVVETLKYLPYCRVYVDPSEYDEYAKANPGADIVKCPPGVQGNLCRVRNHIIRSELTYGADAVLLIDDDLRRLMYWEGNKRHAVAAEDLPVILEKYTRLAKELGVYFWGVNCNGDKISYREYTPFSTVSYIGGPFQVFLKGNDCWYDERMPLKEDYDMTLMQCYKHRRVLRINRLHYDCRQSEQAGGCAMYRNVEREQQQFLALQKKWGSKIVKRDCAYRFTKKKKAYKDYNPVIHIPIKGV